MDTKCTLWSRECNETALNAHRFQGDEGVETGCTDRWVRREGHIRFPDGISSLALSVRTSSFLSPPRRQMPLGHLVNARIAGCSGREWERAACHVQRWASIIADSILGWDLDHRVVIVNLHLGLHPPLNRDVGAHSARSHSRSARQQEG
jgi:hypothetical protein